MPILRASLDADDGALVDPLLGWGAANAQTQRLALRPVPPSVGIKALLDTGAQVTCIDTALVQALGLQPDGFVLANVPAAGGLTYGVRYAVSLTLMHPSGKARRHLTLPDTPVLELPLGPLGYQTLIGRDILARCRFLYDGQGNRFGLAY